MPPHDRLDLARVLLARAVDDETLVRKVCSDGDVADSIVGFHAQQAAEKLIKAVLAARGVAFVKSHALSYLIGLVEENHIEAPDELFRGRCAVAMGSRVPLRGRGTTRSGPICGPRPGRTAENVD
jgi:HEPN domain-containing protein